MKLDRYALDSGMAGAAGAAAEAERQGFAGMWFAETQHNPYLGCALAVEATSTLQVGTGIAVAFPRSPMVTAQIAWDLQQASAGRFLLGLGTQVRAHVKRRFSTEFSRPLARMREYVGALRAIWAAFQQEERLAFSGDFYSFSLLTDFFDPGPIDHPHIPVYLAGVNAGMARLVGQVADGFHVHPFHSRRWLTEVVRPAIADGATSAGRSVDEIELACPVFVMVDDDEADLDWQRAGVREQIGFYGSTPAYRPVFELHGFDDLQPRLQAALRAGELDRLAEVIDDRVLDTCAVTATWDELPRVLLDRYDGIVDRIFPYTGHSGWRDTPERRERWADVARALHGVV